MKEVKSEKAKELFPKGESQHERSFRRWLVREIEAGRLTLGGALERFDFGSTNPESLVRSWLYRYSSPVLLTLPVMTEKERQQSQALEKRLKALEKQLELAQMKNIALETMIDVAEEQLKTPIRKKFGPKQ